MNRRYYFDAERGLAAIRRSATARDYPTADEVRAWMSSGVPPAQYEEPERCEGCGRVSECACPGCLCCNAAGVPRFRRRTDPTGTEGGPGDAP